MNVTQLHPPRVTLVDERGVPVEAEIPSRSKPHITYKLRRTGGRWLHMGQPCEAAQYGAECYHKQALEALTKEETMSESTMFTDLLAAQKEMPALQKTSINPHFGNKFIPLEELITKVLPILNKHNLVLLQYPTIVGESPALSYELLHTSGERIGNTMLLQATKGDPQAQGSAITYARRYSLMSLLGLSADVDDDAETTRDKGPRGGTERPTPARAPQASQQRPAQSNGNRRMPECPQHGDTMKFYPEEPSRNDPERMVSARYKCTTRGCKDAKGYAETVWAEAWEEQLSREAQLAAAPGEREDPDSLPFEGD